MKMFCRSFSVVVVSAMALSGLGLSASAEESDKPVQVNRDRPQMAAGVIVTTTTSKPSTALLRVAEGELGGDTSVAKIRSKGNRKVVLVTNRRISAAEAETLAAVLRKRSDVVSASPNYINYAFGSAPVTTNDTYFNILKQIWDPRLRTDSRVKLIMGSSQSFPAGGYSSKAPTLWRKTTGTDQVVAVVDSGITDHPDLDNQILPGYDFVSQFPLTDEYDNVVAYEDTGRDGDGRDSNPQDEGDWESAGYCYPGGGAYDSSWHGTHIAGIIAAQSNNSEGIVGIAPGVKILPVRVLGQCGGTVEDIADGIRWAAGVSVVGVPLNANPADVINLSLGGSYPCDDAEATDYISAIAAARAAGSVIVAAAGNDGANIVTEPTTPATCAGVISVGSTSEYGDRAGFRQGTTKYVYSNWGSTLDISAPGGDTYWDGRGILSTLNTGTEGPVAPTYGQYDGTSMAAPVVSAGAALIRSLGTFTPAQTEAALKAAVSPFPSGASTQFKKCSTSICGKGILDLSRVPAPLSGPSISGPPVVGETLSAVAGSWNGTPSAFVYAWQRDHSPIAGATGPSYTVTQADVGAKISVRLAPAGAIFSPIIAISPESVEILQGPTVTMTGLRTTARYGVAGGATVTVGTPEAPINGVVQLRRGSTVLASGTTVAGIVNLKIPATSWLAGTNRIRAAFLGNGTDAAVSTVPQTVTVAKARSTIWHSLVASTVKRTSYAKSKVTIRVTGDTHPTGLVRVYDGTKWLKTYKMYASYNGAHTFTLPKITKRGKHSIKWIYAGNANITGKSSTVKTLTVK